MKAIQINRELLQNLYGDCQESFTDIFSEFINNFSEMKTGLLSAFNSGSLLLLKRQFHSNGPSFLYLGLPTVAELFKQMEYKCGDANDTTEIAQDFNEMINVIDECYYQATDEIAFCKQAS